jgi:hypothetical protein
MSLFEKAKEKVMASKILRKFAQFILADWAEGDEHWRWVIDADENEIVDWAEATK